MKDKSRIYRQLIHIDQENSCHYFITNHGNIEKCDAKKIAETNSSHYRYNYKKNEILPTFYSFYEKRMYWLFKGKKYYIDYLVYHGFYRNPKAIEWKKYDIAHLDGDGRNNNYHNLALCPKGTRFQFEKEYQEKNKKGVRKCKKSI